MQEAEGVQEKLVAEVRELLDLRWWVVEANAWGNKDPMTHCTCPLDGSRGREWTDFREDGGADTFWICREGHRFPVRTLHFLGPEVK